MRNRGLAVAWRTSSATLPMSHRVIPNLPWAGMAINVVGSLST
jgi:hypothetical protein